MTKKYKYPSSPSSNTDVRLFLLENSIKILLDEIRQIHRPFYKKLYDWYRRRFPKKRSLSWAIKKSSRLTERLKPFNAEVNIEMPCGKYMGDIPLMRNVNLIPDKNDQ